MSGLAVECCGISKRYKHFALSNIDLSLPTGHILGFIGPNGAGKSTLIRILLGLVHQDSGEAHVLGHAMPQDQILAKRDIGFISEDMRLYPQATLAWHMAFIQSIYPKWDEVYARHLLQCFELNAAQLMRDLSHGQRVKAALLLVLARRPALLILDEPTTGLDPVARYEVLEQLAEILKDEERSVFMSSHNTVEIEQISDLIAFIDQGRLIDTADKESFLDRWRRIRVEMPPEGKLPSLPNIVEHKQSGRLATLITDGYSDAAVSALTAAGLVVQAVEALSLEEIFVANVRMNRRETVR